MQLKKISVLVLVTACLCTNPVVSAYADTTIPFIDEGISLAYEIADNPKSDLDIADGTAYCTSTCSSKNAVSITVTQTLQGRVAITLYGIPYGHDYDLYLYDSSQKCIYSSQKSGSSTEVVKTPAVTSSTKYYVVVKAKNVPDYSKSTYRLKVDEYMVTKSVTSSFEPRTLVAESGVWSSDGIADKTSLPSDAIVVSAKVSASAPNTKAAYNHTLRVKIGSGSYIPVTWKSGDIDVPQLVGKKCCGKWYVGFKATMIPGVSALNYISMSGFRLKVEYEYDSMPNV